MDGEHFDAEVHFVHLNEKKDKYLVVGLIFDTTGAYNEATELFMEDFDWEHASDYIPTTS